MNVWTRQDKKILDEIKKNKKYFCKEEYINKKMEDFSGYYKNLYKWYSKRAEKIINKPCEDVKYPIWVSLDEEMRLQPVEGQVILKLSIDKERLVITDFEKWGYVVNYLYLPLNKDDYNEHKEELKKYNIGDPTALVNGDLGNFYPILKNKVINSWERLFMDYELSSVKQATLWQIKEEDIVDIIDGDKIEK